MAGAGSVTKTASESVMAGDAADPESAPTVVEDASARNGAPASDEIILDDVSESGAVPVAAAAERSSSVSVLVGTASRKKWWIVGGAALAVVAGTCAVVVSGGGGQKSVSANGAAVDGTAKSATPPTAEATPPAPTPPTEVTPPPTAEATPPPPAPAEVTPGFLRVETKPRGATVFIDGVEWKEKTPALVDGLSPGDHNLALALDGRKPREAPVAVTSGKTTRVSFELEREPVAAVAPPAKDEMTEPAPKKVSKPKRATPERVAKSESTPVAKVASRPPSAESSSSPRPVTKTEPASAPKADSRGHFDAAAWRRQMWQKRK